MTISRSTLVLAATLVAGPLAAQAPGLPVMNGGVARGLNLAAMVGFGNDASGGGTAVGLSGALGFRRIGIGAFVSTLGSSNLSGSAIYGIGGSLTAKVLGGPLVPVAVNLQAGAGFHSVGSGVTGRDVWQVPVGVGISWTFPQPIVAIKPWISPRLEYRRISGAPGGGSQSATDFGLSGGVTFGFLNGIGIDLAIDRLFADGSGKPTTIGVGLSLNRK